MSHLDVVTIHEYQNWSGATQVQMTGLAHYKMITLYGGTILWQK